MVPAENVNIGALLAKCNACSAVFSIAGSAGAPKTRRADVAMPKSISMAESDSELRITRKWYTPMAFFMIAIALAWNAVMVVWLISAIKSGTWGMFAMGSIHGCVGLFLIYFTVALFVNKTEIKVDSRSLSVKHGPLPWRGDATLPADMVHQIWCKMKVERGKNSSHNTMSYELHANSKHGKSKKLLSHLQKPEEALFLEQQLEAYMRIEDRPVAGAFTGT
jgi:hypothetical protein